MGETGALIVGAGPTGLALACELARRGAPLRIMDASAGPSTMVKASELHSRTLEVLEDMGVLERALAVGVPVYGMTVYAEGRRALHAGYDDLDAPYPYQLVCGQAQTEKLLVELLAGRGCEVERRTRVEAVERDGDGAVATVRGPRGASERIHARYVVGCDGAHSLVRHVVGAAVEGEACAEQWIVGDVRLDWDLEPDEQYAFVSGARGFSAVICQPLPQDRWQVAGPLPADPRATEPSLAELQAFFDRSAAVAGRLSDPAWLAVHRVQRRWVDHRVDGPLILAGDAAHVRRPVGGAGLNAGIQDAHNLGWKLALVLADAGPPELIDSYAAERQAAARRLVSAANRDHLLRSLRQPLARELRDHVIALLGHFDSVTDRSHRDQSQIGWGYRASPIVGDVAAAGGGPRAGDRAPDSAQVRAGVGRASRLLEVLAGAEHVLLLFLGCEQPVADTVAAATAIAQRARDAYGDRIAPHLVVPAERFDAEWPVIADPIEAVHTRYGARDACLVLIRPDGHIGFRAQPPSFQALAAHLEAILVPSTACPSCC